VLVQANNGITATELQGTLFICFSFSARLALSRASPPLYGRYK
jgi:hypothetical protein